jgi:hypothetical protein
MRVQALTEKDMQDIYLCECSDRRCADPNRHDPPGV